MKSAMPSWAVPVKRIHEFVRGRGLKAKSFKLKLMFFNYGIPISEIWLRPHLIRYDELRKSVYARFEILDPVTGAKFWIMEPYRHSAEGFCHEVPPEQINLATALPGLIYYDQEKRDEVQVEMARRGETESWRRNEWPAAKARAKSSRRIKTC